MLHDLQTFLAGIRDRGLDSAIFQDPGGTRTRYTPSLAAYEAYLKGRYYQFSFTAEHQTRCREYFSQPIKADPRYTLGHHGLALHYFTLAVFHLMPAHDAMPLARAGVAERMNLTGTLKGCDT